tara:strand:+ start:557 stop:1849 length:1293 start_codon:yes stop_codon:yes gene_type:complete
MQTLFFIKNAKATPTATNSINLRFKLVETGKFKVKGIGISCSLKDWNQDDQQVRRSHPQYKKYNSQLEFITIELEKIEKERNVTDTDISTIVEASIKGLTVQELEDKGNLLTGMLNGIYEVRLDNKAYAQNSVNKFLQLKSTIERFEAKAGYQITANSLNKSTLSIQNDLVSYYRSMDVKDSSIKAYLTALNTAIRYYTKLTGNQVKTFSKIDSKWEKTEKQIVALNTPELQKLYEFTFNPIGNSDIKTTRFELKNLKLFLFRCFSGMRISDMNKKNINPNSLTATSTTFTYFQDKGVKSTTVFCIASYLFDIATSLDWDFPEYTTDDSLRGYGRRETAAVRKHLSYLLKDNQRQIQHITEKGYVYTNLSDEVSTHTARKTFAHLLYSLTNNIMLVMKQLGHTKIEITMKYLDFDINSDSMDLKSVQLGF